MFEPSMYEKARQTGEPARPTAPYEAARDVERMSLLVWGEHCVECAAPACYQTCDLYDRRPDRRCRRFAFGIYRNPNFPSLRGYGAEVVFKKWGKLEARGNTRMEPVRKVLARERALEWAAVAAKAVGPTVGRITGDERWHWLGQVLHERIPPRVHKKRTAEPDAFLLEVYNPTPEPVRMQLLMSLGASARAIDPEAYSKVPPCVTTLNFEPGYNRREVESEAFRHIIASGYPFDISLVPEADTDARLVFLTADFVTFARANRSVGAPKATGIKCVVWDLDNTLWGGVLLENESVAIDPRVPALLRELDERGILNSIASKNDHDHAWARLEALGVADYFVYPRIDWSPKSRNIKQIAALLNIGLDTFAFVDDNPFELAEVGEALPEVLCLNVTEIDGLLDHPRFAGSRSPEARQRRRFYKDAMLRDEKKAEFGDDYLGFIAACNVVLDVKPFEPDDADRVAELVQRTNQLNFSGMKYDRAQVAEILADPSTEKYVLQCTDRYGSYGTVGFSLVTRNGDEVRVRDFMLSCRVQNKFIEQAFFHALTEAHGPHPASRLWINFRATKKNTPAQQVLNNLGFTPAEDGEGVAVDLTGRSLACPQVTVRYRAAVVEAAAG